MRKSSQIKVKKLALAYKTGWEYVPEGEEAGSVLTDIFLDMAEENRWRYEQIWGKQERVFQGAVPVSESGEGSLSGELAVKVSDEGHGEWLEEGCEVHLPQENGALLRFQTVRPLPGSRMRRTGKDRVPFPFSDGEERNFLIRFFDGIFRLYAMAWRIFALRWNFAGRYSPLCRCRGNGRSATGKQTVRRTGDGRPPDFV